MAPEPVRLLRPASRTETAGRTREAKKAEDQAAVGGMRFPLEAARRVPASFVAGRRVRRALTKVLSKFTELPVQLEGLVHGDKVVDLPAAAVMEARSAIANEFGAAVPDTHAASAGGAPQVPPPSA